MLVTLSNIATSEMRNHLQISNSYKDNLHVYEFKLIRLPDTRKELCKKCAGGGRGGGGSAGGELPSVVDSAQT